MDFGTTTTETISGQRAKVYLHPGQIFVSAERSAVTTILGSCVAVCLYDPYIKVGGMNHFLLPFDSGEGQAERFGNRAVDLLIDRLLALGSARERLRAKLFGGACVLDAFRDRQNHLGTQNVQVAREILTAAEIPIVSADVEGRRGRKLIFHTDDGSAWIKSL
jgi:chemotaxis protein CheD